MQSRILGARRGRWLVVGGCLLLSLSAILPDASPDESEPQAAVAGDTRSDEFALSVAQRAPSRPESAVPGSAQLEITSTARRSTW